MGTCPHRLDVFAIQDRRKHGMPRPWIARWRVDGRMVSRSFRTRVEADRFRSLLVQAVTTDEAFDLRTGEPTSWSAAPSEASQISIFEWCRRWLAEQWPECDARGFRHATHEQPEGRTATGLQLFRSREGSRRVRGPTAPPLANGAQPHHGWMSMVTPLGFHRWPQLLQ
jgi:hypothetical protein